MTLELLSLLREYRDNGVQALSDHVLNNSSSKLIKEETVGELIQLKGSIHTLEELLEIKEFLLQRVIEVTDEEKSSQ